MRLWCEHAADMPIGAPGMVTALKFGGLALRVASGLAASIGRDAEKVLTQLEPPADPQVRQTQCADVAVLWKLRIPCS